MIAIFQFRKRKRNGAKRQFQAKETAYGIAQQYPKEIVDRRKNLYPYNGSRHP